MKKMIFLCLIAGTLLVILGSFTHLYPTKAKAATQAEAKEFGNCTGGVGTVTLVSDNGSYVKFSWTYTGNPYSYQYGGYYNPGGTITPGTVYTNTVTIPAGPGDAGRFGVAAYCSDGTSVGSGHGVLWSHGQVTGTF